MPENLHLSNADLAVLHATMPVGSDRVILLDRHTPQNMVQISLRQGRLGLTGAFI